jgi:hypothetical protein
MWRNNKEPLNLVMDVEPFMKWGLDFMGLIKLTTRHMGNQYIFMLHPLPMLINRSNT